MDRLRLVVLLLVVSCQTGEVPAGRDRDRCSGVCGRVTDASTKQPLRRFTVTLFSVDKSVGRVIYKLPPGYPQPPGPVVASVTVESDDGWFDVGTGGATPVIVTVAAQGYAPHQTEPFAPGALPITFSLDSAPPPPPSPAAGDAALRGTIRSASGAPVRGAAVEVRCHDTTPLQALARNDGTFEVLGLPRAICEVAAARELENDVDRVSLDAVRGRGAVDLTGGTASIELTIPSSGRVSGRISGLDRVDDGYAVVAARGNERITIRAASDGTFSRVLPAGRWMLTGTFEEPGTYLETRSAPVAVTDATSSRVDLAFEDLSTVLVRLEGQPLHGELTFEPRDANILTRARLFPQKPGTWSVAGLARGTYEARLRVWQWDVSFDVTVPSSRTIELRRHAIVLDLHDAERRPVRANVTIAGRPSRADGVAVASLDTPVLAGDANGRHAGWEILPGQYELSIEAPGYKPARTTVTVPGTPASLLLQTIDRPFPRPAELARAGDAETRVIRAVVADLADKLNLRLGVADETVRWPRLQSLRNWETGEPIDADPSLTRGDPDAVHRLSGEVFRDFQLVPLSTLPLIHPAGWTEAPNEAALFDPAANVALFATPIIRGGSAFAYAVTYSGGERRERLYELESRGGQWLVTSARTITTEPAC